MEIVVVVSAGDDVIVEIVAVFVGDVVSVGDDIIVVSVVVDSVVVSVVVSVGDDVLSTLFQSLLMIDGVAVVAPVVITLYNDGIVSQVDVAVQGVEI